MLKKSENRRAIFVSLIVTAAMASSGEAHADTRATLDVSLGGKVGSNPFLGSGGDNSDGAVSLDIAPAFRIEDEVSKVALTGRFRADRYLDRYGEEFAGRVGLSASRAVSERTKIFGNAGFQTTRSSVQDTLFAVPGELIDDPEAPEIPLPDVTIAGQRARTYSYSAGLGVEHVLSPVDSIGLNVDAGLFKYANRTDADYRSAGAGVEYSRRLSERTAITGSVQVGLVDYIDREPGDGYYITPLIGIQQQLSETMKLSASAGVSFSSTELPIGSRNKSTAFAGNVSLCNRQENSGLCASASRRTRPTALGGLSSVTSFSVTYDRDLSLRDRISFSGRYGRNDRSNAAALPTLDDRTEVLGISAHYSRKFSDRLSAFISPSYTKIYDDTDPRKANFQVVAGITVRFGKLR